MGSLAGKTALLTGAACGIGKATAELFIAQGAKVILTDKLDDEGQKLAHALGSNAEFMSLDVSEEAAWQRVATQIQKKYGKIEVLFNNAGVSTINELEEAQDPEHASLAMWQRVHAVNSDSVFLGCQHGIKLMKSHGGSIINMSSRSALVGVPDLCAYAASKAAVRSLSKSVALYCARQGYPIRCNSVCPAAILTAMWDSILGDTEQARTTALEAIQASIPLGRMGEPIDVAYAVLYLASDQSKFVTGTELIIDGGILAASNAAPRPAKLS
jgi:3(or 17)beta-hydroxysteroid dehydrogenase